MIGPSPKVVVVGGGVAGLEVVLGLAESETGPVSVTLLDPGESFVYRPMSVVEPFDGIRAPSFEFASLLAGTGVQLVADSLSRVDVEQNAVFTSSGTQIDYDALVLALGARKFPTIDNALTFCGSADCEAYVEMLAEIERKEVTDIAFVVPSGIVWSLPLYEFALLTEGWLRERGITANLSVVTPEQIPLRIFGLKASRGVTEMLERHGIRLLHSTHVAGYDGETLSLVPDAHLQAHRVVTVPRLEGPDVPGVPHDDHGFMHTNPLGLVDGTTAVYAAGDGTSFPVKQGVIAAQQADAIVSAIAAKFGATQAPQPFRPTMRGLLISSEGPFFMEAEIAGGSGDAFHASSDPLWESADKVPGKYLSRRLRDLGLDRRTRPL